MSLTKYIAVAKTSWSNGFVYRLNFVMWRVRNVIQLLTIYYLWSAVTATQDQIFTYTQSTILTYILGSSIIRAVVLSSRSIDAQGEIASGDLSNYLLKPVNYFSYWGARDISDKVLNVIFSIAEVSVLIFLINPPLFIQTNPTILLTFVLSAFLGAVLFFYFSFIISMTTFWFYQYNGWAQRFLSFVLIEALAGGLFPLDILPPLFTKFISILPTTYFLFFPMQIYLGRVNLSQSIIGLITTLIWIFLLYYLGKFIWRKGLKVYGAFGR